MTCIHKPCVPLSPTSRYCDDKVTLPSPPPFSLFSLLVDGVEGNILDSFIEFPRNTLLYLETTLLLGCV